MKRLSLALGLLIAAYGVPANASSTTGYGYIGQIWVAPSGAVLFNVNAARTAVPTCQGAGLTQRFALDVSAVAGQAQLQILLEAMRQGRRVTILGLGNCTIWTDTETVSLMTVE